MDDEVDEIITKIRGLLRNVKDLVLESEKKQVESRKENSAFITLFISLKKNLDGTPTKELEEFIQVNSNLINENFQRIIELTEGLQNNGFSILTAYKVFNMQPEELPLRLFMRKYLELLKMFDLNKHLKVISERDYNKIQIILEKSKNILLNEIFEKK